MGDRLSSAHGPSRFGHYYTLVMLFVLGLFFMLGGLNELVANLAPQLMPDVISSSLEQSGYDLLHAHPVVKWWTRIHNVANIFVGAAALVGVVMLQRGRRGGWRLLVACLMYVLIAGGVGAIIISTFLFPVLDELGPKLPVSPDGMKMAMIAGPGALMLVGAIKLKFLRKYRSYYLAREA